MVPTRNGIISAARRKQQRGATLVLFTILVSMVVIPLTGLAIDGSITFWAKAKLSAAVDASALAAGRAINISQSAAANTAHVQDVANQWFWANFPSGWNGSSIVGGAPTVVGPVKASNSTMQVSVTASASVPLYFMRVIGFNNVTVSATAQSSRRNINLVLVLDRSGSMGPNGSNACPIMQQDSINFVNGWQENFDTLGLVTYSSSAGPAPDVAPSQVFKTNITNAIGSINCTGATSMAQALHIAYQTIQTQNLQSGLNVIVLFTDGQPNEVVDNFPVKQVADTRYGPGDGGGNESYSVQSTWPPSGCKVSSILGGLTVLKDPAIPYAAQGWTGGLFDVVDQVPLSTSASILNSPGCAFSSMGDYMVRKDIAYLPALDYYNNKTVGGYGSNAPYYGAGISTVDTFSSGPYAGQIRPDEVTVGVIASSINAADYQAQVIRNDSTYSTVILTIGMGGAPDLPIDFTLLERIANDPRSPIFDSTKMAGYFAYASDPSQLNQAFTQIRSQVLRLSK